MKLIRRGNKFTKKEKLEAYIKMVDLYMYYHLKEMAKSPEEHELFKMAYLDCRVGLKPQFNLGVPAEECAIRCKRIFES
jgi:hypothetical protein